MRIYEVTLAIELDTDSTDYKRLYVIGESFFDIAEKLRVYLLEQYPTQTVHITSVDEEGKVDIE